MQFETLTGKIVDVQMINVGELKHGDFFVGALIHLERPGDPRMKFLSLNYEGNAMVAGNSNGKNFVQGFESGYNQRDIVVKVTDVPA